MAKGQSPTEITTNFAKAKASSIVIAEKMMRGLVLGVYGRIIDNTRVDEGTLRGNNQVTLNSPATGTLNIKDPNGSRANQFLEFRTTQYKIADKIFLTNNMSYADVIENGGPNRRGDFVWKRELARTNAALIRSYQKNKDNS